MSLGGSLHLRPEAGGFNQGVLRQSVQLVPKAVRVQRALTVSKQRKAIDERRKKRIARADTKHWNHDKCCCQRGKDLHDGRACHEEYSDDLVHRIRLYFENLSDSNQRIFYLQRFRSIDLDDTPDDEDLTRKCKGELRMEKPDVLARRLTNHESGLFGLLLPNPATNTLCTQYMCSDFFSV